MRTRFVTFGEENHNIKKWRKNVSHGAHDFIAYIYIIYLSYICILVVSLESLETVIHRSTKCMEKPDPGF